MFNNKYVEKVFTEFKTKNKGQDEYIQACQEILESLELYIEKNPNIEKYSL